MSDRDYLAVDRFLKTELGAQALSVALHNGLVDRLAAGPCALTAVPVRNAIGRRLLVDLLVANGVVERQDDRLALTPAFRAVLGFRALIDAKIAMASTVARDVAAFLPLLIDDLPAFMARSATFGLFRYDRCFEATPANVAATRAWMRYTSALTRHEGQVLAGLVDLAGCRRLLDVGGNSGELALQLCAAHPGLAVTVFDLPVVGLIAAEHVRQRGGAARIDVVTGDMRGDPLPAPVDAVTLKSLLHDWPAAEAAAILRRAALALRPGGLLVIFERAAFRTDGDLTYAQLANLVFLHFFRTADLYLDTLHALGFEAIRHATVSLDMDFHLITARRPAGPA